MHRTPQRRATWWRSPQRVWLRRALFQIHLWLGLILTLYAIVIGLSGSALVFKREIDRPRHPDVYKVQVGPQRMSLDTLVQSAEASRTGWKVSSILGFRPDVPLTLLMRPAHGALSSNYRAVVVQPYTGAVLADAMRFDGTLGWLSNLHFYLLAGKTGLLLSGWMSVGLVVLCLSGLVVWWPGVSRCASAFFFRRRRRWRRLLWDLHSVTGFWLAVPLLLLSLTGCYFAFPAPVTAVVDLVTLNHHAHSEKAPPILRTATNDRPFTLDQAFARATALLPKAAPLGYFALPSRPGGTYYATGYYVGAAPYSKLVSVSFDGRTGKQQTLEDTTQQPAGRRLLQYVFTLHFGSFAGDGFAGDLVKGLWVLIGLSPALLAVTGVLLFALRKLRAPRKREHAKLVYVEPTVSRTV